MDITCLILLFREARILAQSPTASEEFISRLKPGNSLAVQWLGFCTLTTEGTGSISNLGTKIPQKRLQQVQKICRGLGRGIYIQITWVGGGEAGKNGREGLMAALEDKQRKNFRATEGKFRAGHTLERMVWI